MADPDEPNHVQIGSVLNFVVFFLFVFVYGLHVLIIFNCLFTGAFDYISTYVLIYFL